MYPTFPEQPSIPERVFLYLSEVGFADSWVNGGTVPVRPASQYLGQRNGIYTPDEVSRIETWGVEGDSQKAIIAAAKNFGTSKIRFVDINFEIDGKVIPVDDGSVVNESQDSLILSFSKSLSKSLADRLGKKAVVEILDIRGLSHIIGQQIGAETHLERVTYTETELRNCFLKSKADQWQHEVRMAWFAEDCSERFVTIPKGSAVPIQLESLPDIAHPPDCLMEADYDRFNEELARFRKEENEYHGRQYELEQARVAVSVVGNRKERRRAAKLNRKRR